MIEWGTLNQFDEHRDFSDDWEDIKTDFKILARCNVSRAFPRRLFPLRLLGQRATSRGWCEVRSYSLPLACKSDFGPRYPTRIDRLGTTTWDLCETCFRKVKEEEAVITVNYREPFIPVRWRQQWKAAVKKVLATR